MANRAQLSMLMQSVFDWNRWRSEHVNTEINLSRVNLSECNLNGVNLSSRNVNKNSETILTLVNLCESDFSHANLYQADLSGSNMIEAILRTANLTEADLSDTNLTQANLSNAKLGKANISGALLNQAFLDSVDLSEADLRDANLSDANLNGANLTKAKLDRARLVGSQLVDANFTDAILSDTDLSFSNLSRSNLRGADLRRSNLQQAHLMDSNLVGAGVGDTIFGDLDLSETVGLDKVIHFSPSTIGINTIAKSKGQISEKFLRGCGLSDWEIEAAKLYDPELNNQQINKILYHMYDLRATQAMQISPLFISYSHGDGAFVDKLGDHLTKKGIRFWRDVHNLKSGRMEKQIDSAMRLNPTVLVVLSEYSLHSDWVEHEVRSARALEKELGRDVLCPVALDDNWKNSPWSKRVMEQVMEYNILNFSNWKDDGKFENIFNKLIDGLELFYK